MLREAITATAGLRTRPVNDLIGHDRSDSQADGTTRLFASGGDLGLQDGHRCMVEVVAWLRWKPGRPGTIGPGQAEPQAKSVPAALRLALEWPLGRAGQHG